MLTELPTSSENNKTFYFELRDDIKWDNGEQVTGEDVIFSAKIMLCHLTNNSQIRPIYNSVIKSVKLNPTNPLKFSMTAQDINWTAKTILGGIYIQQKSYWDPNKVLDKISVEGLTEKDIPSLTKKAYNKIKSELENDPKQAAVKATNNWKKILS